MKTTYDKVTIADGQAARDRLTKKARLTKPDPAYKDIARLNKYARPRPRRSEWTDLTPDTTGE